MSQRTLTYTLSPSEAPSLKSRLGDVWTFSVKPYTIWQARGPYGTVSFYESGKLVLQSKDMDDLLDILQLDHADHPSTTPAKTTRASTAASAPLNAEGRLAIYEQWRTGFGEPDVHAWIGIDEAGKGDFFGPLITAAVRVETKDLPWLAEMGVGDSKQIHDKNIKTLAAQLKAALPYGMVVLMPATYNKLYRKFHNLNRLLAWTHATASEDVLSKAPATLILSDQFSKAPLVPSFFKGAGKNCRYVQQTKAESDAAVGCASILARAEFLWRMHELEQQFGLRLNKGAGSPTIADAKRFVARHGKDALENAAKTHFKTMERL